MQITTTHKRAIDQYYNELEAYHDHKVTHETAVRSVVQYLLASFAKSANWTLIPEQILENGKRPDGTMRDTFNLPRGYGDHSKPGQSNQHLVLYGLHYMLYSTLANKIF